MKTRLTIITICCVMALSVCASGKIAENEFPAETMSGLDALEFFRENDLSAGWNLGNTLDAYNNGIAGETLWGNPRVTAALMQGVKAAGFNLVRIPITWMGHIGPRPNYIVSESRLKRVEEIACLARDAGLVVIINLHHDGGTSSPSKEDGWLSISKATRNPDEYKRITAQFTAVWKQIATYFKNYGDWLIFESFNELHDGNWGSGSELWPQFITLNAWNQIFMDTVRETGGNNADRYLMVASYSQNLRHLLSESFQLPADSAANKLIVSFHYYDPYNFGIEGKQPAWGSEQDKQQVVKDFTPLKAKFVDNNIPVVMGECGAVLQLYPSDAEKQEQARLSRREYLPFIFNTAREYGIVPVYWDNGGVTGTGEKFGLIKRSDGKPISDESDFLLKVMTGR